MPARSEAAGATSAPGDSAARLATSHRTVLRAGKILAVRTSSSLPDEEWPRSNGRRRRRGRGGKGCSGVRDKLVIATGSDEDKMIDSSTPSRPGPVLDLAATEHFSCGECLHATGETVLTVDGRASLIRELD